MSGQNVPIATEMRPPTQVHPPLPPSSRYNHSNASALTTLPAGGSSYLVIVDRYSNWPVVKEALAGATGLVASLKNVFATFGIPEELASDGGPEFTASATRNFLSSWGVHH